MKRIIKNVLLLAILLEQTSVFGQIFNADSSKMFITAPQEPKKVKKLHSQSQYMTKKAIGSIRLSNCVF